LDRTATPQQHSTFTQPHSPIPKTPRTPPTQFSHNQNAVAILILLYVVLRCHRLADNALRVRMEGLTFALLALDMAYVFVLAGVKDEAKAGVEQLIGCVSGWGGWVFFFFKTCCMLWGVSGWVCGVFLGVMCVARCDAVTLPPFYSCSAQPSAPIHSTPLIPIPSAPLATPIAHTPSSTAVALNTIMFVVPLSSMASIIKHRDSSSIFLPWAAASTVCSLCWVCTCVWEGKEGEKGGRGPCVHTYA
jgi:hypothetical protein